MNRATSPTGWAKNPDGTPGYTWNPISGCNNHINGMCKGGNFPCYAYGLATTRLKERYLDNPNIAIPKHLEGLDLHSEDVWEYQKDPFYPRFWEDRLFDFGGILQKPKGIFVCDMSDLFGIGIPEEWQERVFARIKLNPENRFYLLTKQPQNLARWSPFPDNCWVGVTATNWLMFSDALGELAHIKAKVKYISFEPLLERIQLDELQKLLFRRGVLDWVIIGAQTKPKKLPEWEWVKEIIEACDKAGIPVFLKDNLGLPKLSCDGATPFYKKAGGTMELRQELPGEQDEIREAQALMGPM